MSRVAFFAGRESREHTNFPLQFIFILWEIYENEIESLINLLWQNSRYILQFQSFEKNWFKKKKNVQRLYATLFLINLANHI